jgi:hypothetical protein
MASRCLESRETGAQGDVEERSRRKGVEVVVCLDKNVG